MNKVVYINYVSFSSSLDDVLYIDHLTSNRVDVEFWDITSLYKYQSVRKYSINIKKVLKINSKKDLKEKIRKENKDNTIFFNLFTYSWDTLWVHLLLKSYGCKTGWFDRPGLPLPNVSLRKKTLDIFKTITLKKILQILQHRFSSFLKRIGYVPEPIIVFTAGKKSNQNYNQKTMTIEINHYDYENYISLRQHQDRRKSKPYAVFLDEFTPYHPDYDLLKIKKVNPDVYYNSVNKFFNMIEEKYNLEIVIAQYPKSDYQTDVYEGREMIKHQTNQLIRDSQFVLAHGSTALSFAVLYSKPILFFYNDQFEMYYKNSDLRSIRNLSYCLGGSIYNIDKLESIEDIHLNEVDFSLYEEFKYNYLTSTKSEDKFTKDIFLNYLQDN